MATICHYCKTHSVISVTAKCSDCCGVSYNNKEREGYVPNDIGIGGGNYIEFSYCHICMRIQSEAITLDTIKSKFEADVDENED